MEYTYKEDSNGIKYKIYNGTAYKIDTPDDLVLKLEYARENRIRLTIDYGDTKTLKSWGEDNDIHGYIGRSTGTIKIPLLIKKSNSFGGGSILDDCILSLRYSKGKQLFYQLTLNN